MALSSAAEQSMPQPEAKPKPQALPEVAKPRFNKVLEALLKDNPALAINTLANRDKARAFFDAHLPANDQSDRTSPLLASSDGKRVDGFSTGEDATSSENQKSDLEKALDKARHDLVDARFGVKGLLRSAIGSDVLAEKNKTYNDLLKQFNSGQLDALGENINDPKILEKAMRDATIGEWNKLKQEEADINEQRIAESHVPTLLKKSYKFLVDKYSQAMAAGTNALAGQDAKWYKKMAASAAIGFGVNVATLGIGGIAMRAGGAAVLSERINKGLDVYSGHKVSESQEKTIKQGLQEVAGAGPDSIKDKARQWIEDQSSATSDRYKNSKWVNAGNLGISLATAAGVSIATRSGAHLAGEGLHALANTEIGQVVTHEAGKAVSTVASVAQELIGIKPANAYTEGPLDPTGIPPFKGKFPADTHPAETQNVSEEGAKLPQTAELKVADHATDPSNLDIARRILSGGIGIADRAKVDFSDIMTDVSKAVDAIGHNTGSETSHINTMHLGQNEHSLWKFFTDYAKTKDSGLTPHQLNNIAANAINHFTPDQIHQYFPHGVHNIQPGQEVPVDEHALQNMIDHAKNGVPLEHSKGSANILDHDKGADHGGAGHEPHGGKSGHVRLADRAYDVQQNIRGKVLDVEDDIYNQVFSENSGMTEQQKIDFMQKMSHQTHPAEISHTNYTPGTAEDSWASKFNHQISVNHEKFGQAGLPQSNETSEAYLLRIAEMEHDTQDVSAPETEAAPAVGESGPNTPETSPSNEVSSFPDIHNVSKAEQLKIANETTNLFNQLIGQDNADFADKTLQEVLSGRPDSSLERFIQSAQYAYGGSGNPRNGETTGAYIFRIVAYNHQVRIP